jgi:hypothetical protein
MKKTPLIVAIAKHPYNQLVLDARVDVDQGKGPRIVSVLVFPMEAQSLDYSSVQ